MMDSAKTTIGDASVNERKRPRETATDAIHAGDATTATTTADGNGKRQRPLWDPMIMDKFQRALVAAEVPVARITGIMDVATGFDCDEMTRIQQKFEENRWDFYFDIYRQCRWELLIDRCLPAESRASAKTRIPVDAIRDAQSLRNQLKSQNIEDCFPLIYPKLENMQWFGAETELEGKHKVSEWVDDAAAIKDFIRNCVLNPGLLIKDIPGINGIQMISSLFIRSCYMELLPRILAEAEKCQVATVGDPGIGKSTLSIIIFITLLQNALENKQPIRVVHISEGGMGLIAFSRGDNDLHVYYEDNVTRLDWMLRDTWLLLDGCASEVPYVDKRVRGIVFASPRQHNYHVFVKNFGKTFYMPAWSWAEVQAYLSALESHGRSDELERFRCDPKLLGDSAAVGSSSIVESSAVSGTNTSYLSSAGISEMSGGSPTESPENSNVMNNMSNSEAVEVEVAPYFSNEQSQSFLESLKTSDEASISVQELVRRRFALVGGKIRWLLSSVHPLPVICDKVKSAVEQLKSRTFFALDTLQYQGNDPSIAYTMIPSQDYTTFKIQLASPLAVNHANCVLQQHIYDQQRQNYLSFRNTDGSSVSGQMFENRIHGVFMNVCRKRTTISGRIRQLIDSKSNAAVEPKDLNVCFKDSLADSAVLEFLENGSVTLNISGLNRYENAEALKQIGKSYTPGVYLIPNSKNHADIDSLAYPSVFFQITISPNHPFAEHRVKQIWNELLPTDDVHTSNNAVTNNQTEMNRQPQAAPVMNPDTLSYETPVEQSAGEGATHVNQSTIGGQTELNNAKSEINAPASPSLMDSGNTGTVSYQSIDGGATTRGTINQPKVKIGSLSASNTVETAKSVTKHFVYIVPEDVFDSFQYQTPKDTKVKKSLEKPDPSRIQYVMTIRNDKLFRLS